MCVIPLDGKDIDKRSTFSLSHGSTRNISVAPWKVLGHVLAVSPTGSQKASAKRLEDKLLAAVKNIDNRPIRGEFKIWILELPSTIPPLPADVRPDIRKRPSHTPTQAH